MKRLFAYLFVCTLCMELSGRTIWTVCKRISEHFIRLGFIWLPLVKLKLKCTNGKWIAQSDVSGGFLSRWLFILYLGWVLSRKAIFLMRQLSSFQGLFCKVVAIITLSVVSSCEQAWPLHAPVTSARIHWPLHAPLGSRRGYLTCASWRQIAVA